MDNPKLSVLIPAAGASKRLGQSKQLIDCHGRPLLQHVIDVVSSINPLQIIVITGADANAIRDTVQAKNVYWVHNADWADGLGSSIALGAQAVSPESGGLMIMLCDQYRVTAADLQKLVEAWQANPDHIVAAKAVGRCMPPLIFPADLFDAIENLAGKNGAHGLLEQHPARVIAVPMGNAAFDLDTPEQLLSL